MSMVMQAERPTFLWPFSLRNAIHVRNRMKHSTLVDSPFFIVKSRKQNLASLKLFDYTAYVLRQPRGANHEPRVCDEVYLDILDNNVYRIVTEQNEGCFGISESRHVPFDESKYLGAEEFQELMKKYDRDNESNGREPNSDFFSCSV